MKSTKQYIKSNVAVLNADTEFYFHNKGKVNKAGFNVIRYNNEKTNDFGTIYTSEWRLETNVAWIDGEPTQEQLWSGEDSQEVLVECSEEGYYKGLLVTQTRLNRATKEIQTRQFVKDIFSVSQKSFFDQIEYILDDSKEENYTDWE